MKRFIIFSALILTCSVISSQVNLTIDASKEYQTIEGLGGFGHFSSGASFNDMYFKQVVDNLGCNFFRLELQPDFVKSADSLTNNQTNMGAGTGMALNVGFINTIKQKGDFKYIFTVWSPPPFMKKNKTPNCVCCVGYNKDYKCDTLNYLIPSEYGNYAKYLGMYAKQIKASTGTDIFAIGIQNEPMFNEPYNSALLYAPGFASCLKTVGAHFEADPALANIKFFGAEHVLSYPRNHGGDYGFWGGNESSKYIQYLLDSASTRKYMYAYATHGNTDGLIIDNGSSSDWTSYANITSTYGKKMWATEMYMDGTNWSTIFNSAEGILMALKYGKVTGWAYWVLGDVLYTSNLPDSRTASVKQFFRFIRPDYKQIDVSYPVQGIAALAFKNGTDMTIVIFNESTTLSKTINLEKAVGTTLPASFQVYRSSAYENCAYLGKSTATSYTLPPQSILTLYYKASEPDVQWAPNAPQNVMATNVTEYSAKITWEATADWTMKALPSNYTVKTSFYYVYRKETNGSYTKLTDQAITSLSYNLLNLKSNTTYTYAIIGRDELFNLSAFAEVTFKTTCTGICVDELPQIESNASIYPNPAQSIVQIESPSLVKSIIITDLTGSVQKTETTNSMNPYINVSSLSDGVYMMQLVGESGIFDTKKIVIAR